MNTLEFIRKQYNLPDTRGIFDIPGMTREDLAFLFAKLRFYRGVEIGTERGHYARTLCQSNPDLFLCCVDPWKAYSGYREHVSQEKLDGFYEETKQRLEPHQCQLIREFSSDALKFFANKSLDFVYIDGNHDYQYVVNDICNWMPKIKSGGIMSGHDYIKRKDAKYKMGVVQAVQGYIDSYHIGQLFIVGSKEKKPDEPRDDTRSWFFVVP